MSRKEYLIKQPPFWSSWTFARTGPEMFTSNKSTIWESPAAKVLKRLHSIKTRGELCRLQSEFTPTAYKTHGLKLCEMSESEMLVGLNRISVRNSLI